jgi:N-acetylglutamate synthase-like GNAT family acetyltransferase
VEPSEYIVRRATFEDLPALQALWSVAQLPALELEKHLTDFQLVTRPDGVVLGAVGMRLATGQGWVHSEAFYTPEHRAPCLPLLWERLRVLARNHRLSRLWTRGRAPFWAECGFAAATDAQLRKLPEAFGPAPAGTCWLTLPLQEDAPLPTQVEEQFKLFQMSQHESTERLLRQATVLKWIAGLIAIGFFAGAMALLFSFYRRSLNRRRR